MSYNVCRVFISGEDIPSFNFEMQSYSIADPVDTTSRYDQKIQTGIGDPFALTGEVNANQVVLENLYALSKNGKFFHVKIQVQIDLMLTESIDYGKCVVQSDVYLQSVNRGEEVLINLALSLNDKKDPVVSERI